MQEQMANSRSLMARERIRQKEEELAYFMAEEERKEEQERIKKRHEQQLQAQRDQEEYRRMKEKEELTKAVLIYEDQCMIRYHDLRVLSETCKDQQAFSVIFMAYDARIRDLIQQIKTLDEKIKVIIEKKRKIVYKRMRKFVDIFVKCQVAFIEKR